MSQSKKISVKQIAADAVHNIFAGFAMGVANVIPGVSGGTMAFILGIFERLIDAIGTIASAETLKLVLKFRIRELFHRIDWSFLLALGVGILAAFAGVSKFVLFMLENHQAGTYAFFFGLIVASIITVYKNVKKWNLRCVISALVGAAAAYMLITLVPISTPNTWYITFLCGVIVICAMILPGISGSFLLLVLGQYNYVWGSIGDFAAGKFSAAGFSTLLALGLGCVIGLAVFVHLLKFLFSKFHDLTVAMLIGFMIGSIPRLWPWQEVTKFAVKTPLGMTEIDGGEIAMAAAKATSSKVTVLAVENHWPEEFDSSFWGLVGLISAGIFVVLVIEFLATTRSSANPGRK